MIRKKFQVVRRDNFLYLTPSLEDKVNLKCDVKNYNHTVQKRRKFNANNIIDIRKELINQKIKGYVYIYIKFIDNSLNKLLNGEETIKTFPTIEESSEYDLNPYLVDNIRIASLNRCKSTTQNKFIYKYDNEDGDEQVISKEPKSDDLVCFDSEEGSYTSNYMFDQHYNSNWIYAEAPFFIDYKKNLAYEKNYFIKTSVSSNGFGFFEIAVRTPNSNSYTPDEAEVVFFIEKEEEHIFNQQYYNDINYNIPEAIQVNRPIDLGNGVYPNEDNNVYAAEVVSIEENDENITHVEVLDQNNSDLPSY